MNVGEERNKKKKESKVKSYSCGSLHVCLITKIPLSYELWKLKTVSITHNLKIRELSDEN